MTVTLSSAPRVVVKLSAATVLTRLLEPTAVPVVVMMAVNTLVEVLVTTRLVDTIVGRVTSKPAWTLPAVAVERWLRFVRVT